MQGSIVNFNRAGIQVNNQFAGTDNAVRVSLAAADDRVNTRNQFAAVKRLCQIIVGAESQPLNLVVEFGKTGENQDGGRDARGAEAAQTDESP